MMTRLFRRVWGVLFGGALALVLAVMALRPLAAQTDLLVMEVSDRSALYLIDIGRALTTPLLRGMVEAPSWSPDGRYIAYLAGTKDQHSNTSIRILEVASGAHRELLPASLGLRYMPPVWSPDGRQLVFAGQQEEDSFNHNIYVINADGSNLRQLTGALSHDVHPAWSPDGRQIAFAMHQGGNRSFNPNLVVMDADCDTQPDGCYRNMRRITSFMSVRYPRWSPDGRQIAFIYSDYNQLYVVDIDGGNLRSLARREGLLWFSWSPDGSQILFASSLGIRTWRLALIDVASGQLHNIESQRNAVAPVWSPDGSRIAFLGVTDRRFNVYVMDRDGTNLRQLTGQGVDGYRFDWSPADKAHSS